jgi:hypothetical protein
MTLDDSIAALYVREINCGCETFWDGGIKVWIGDAVNGHHAETMFSRPHMGRAGQWLVDEAARLFPKAFQQLRLDASHPSDVAAARPHDPHDFQEVVGRRVVFRPGLRGNGRHGAVNQAHKLILAAVGTHGGERQSSRAQHARCDRYPLARFWGVNHVASYSSHSTVFDPRHGTVFADPI